MKTRIVVEEHSIVPGAIVLELWYGSQMIGTVVGADGPGVRIILEISARSDR